MSSWEFYIPDHGEDPDGPEALPDGDVEWCDTPEEAVTVAAEYEWHHRDGWEAVWPLTIVIRSLGSLIQEDMMFA